MTREEQLKAAMLTVYVPRQKMFQFLMDPSKDLWGHTCRINSDDAEIQVPLAQVKPYSEYTYTVDILPATPPKEEVKRFKHVPRSYNVTPTFGDGNDEHEPR